MKRIQRVIDRNIEKKIFNYNLNTEFGTLTTYPTELQLDRPAQGTAGNQRTGRDVRIRSIKFDGILQNGTSGIASDDAFNRVRIMLADWRNGMNTPWVTLGLPSVAMGLEFQTDKDLPYMQNCLNKVFYDKLIIMNYKNSYSAGSAPALRRVRFKVKWPGAGMLIRSPETGGNTGLIQHRLILSMASDSSVAPSPGFLSGQLWVRYTDC